MLPAELGALTQLGTFDLRSNQVHLHALCTVFAAKSVKVSFFRFLRGAGRTVPLIEGLRFIYTSLSSPCADCSDYSQTYFIFFFITQIKEYPVEACRLHLSVLDLSNNSLSGLPPEIGKVSASVL